MKHHYAILTLSKHFTEVTTWIRENKLTCEVHLNRTRFWVPEELLSEFINAYGGYCDFVPDNQDLAIGTPYELCSLEDAEAFAKKRNYTYHVSNTDNPIDFPEWDSWKPNKDLPR